LSAIPTSCRRDRREEFYPQITQISADYDFAARLSAAEGG
jgi:hypothetical protein